MLDTYLTALAAAAPADRIPLLREWHTDLAERENVNAYPETLVSAESLIRPGVGDFTFCLPDLLVDHRGDIRLTEVNASNAAITFPHLADAPRVAHMLDTLLSRRASLGDGAVILVPRASNTTLGPEIQLRAAHLAAMLGPAAGVDTHVRESADADLPQTGVTVVTDTIPNLGRKLVREADALWFRGRQVIFFNNQNLVAEIARLEGTPLNTVFEQLDHTILHEGTLMGNVGMHKGLQQQLAAGTSIVPIDARSAHGLDATVELAYGMARSFGGAVVKPDAASGGIAVAFVDPSHNRDDIRRMLADGAARMQIKYGDGWEAICPMRVYEFADAVPVISGDDRYRWDMRVEVLARPDSTVITPIIARTCPDPIGPVITPGSAMTNLTGRARGANERLNPMQLLARTGLDEDLFERIADGLHAWICNALTVTTLPA
jgi:hypothetical protein